MSNYSNNLSSTQNNIWLTQNIFPNSSLYNVCGYALIEGEINVEKLTESINLVLEQSDVFNIINDYFNQEGLFLLEKYSIRFEEVSNESVLERIQSLAKIKIEGVLLENIIFKSPIAYYWFVKANHILFDGYSMALFFNKVVSVYKNSKPSNLKLDRYNEFLHEEDKYLISSQFEIDRKYFKDKFSSHQYSQGFKSCLKDNKGSGSFTSNRKEIIFNKNSFLEINKFCSENKFSTLHYFISCIYILNSLYSNDSFVLGIPVFNRASSKYKNTLGVFINVLPFIAKIDGADSFMDVLRLIKSEFNEQYRHHHYPIAEIQNQLNIKGSLYNILFSYQKNEYSESFGEVKCSINYLTNGEQIEDLKIHLLEYSDSDDLVLAFDYKDELFSEETINSIIRNYSDLLKTLHHKPDQLIREITYIPHSERKYLLYDLNDTENHSQIDKTLVNLFEHQVNTQPNEIAIVFNNQNFTYNYLNIHANKLAHYLRDKYSIKPNDLVGICFERGINMIISMLGVLKSGGAYVPIDINNPQDRILYIIEDSSCVALINEIEFEKFNSQALRYSENNPLNINSANDLVYVMYTSGSTGKPKGCMLQHIGIINRIDWMWNTYNYNYQDIILQKTAFTFDVSVSEIFMPLCWGAKMILCQKDDVASSERILQLIKINRITSIHFVPSMLSNFMLSVFDGENNLSDLDSLRIVYTSGEALTIEMVKKWYSKMDVQLHNLYGPTEASIEVSSYATSLNDTCIPIGKPIWNTQLYVLNNNLSLLPKGIVGEICVSGIGLSKGYLNKPELTAEKFVSHPFLPSSSLYRTGDLGRILEDGNIEYIGRKDEQVKIRGYRIELGEIENVIIQHNNISDSVVLAKENLFGEKTLVAYITGKNINISKLKKHLAKQLPSYMIPIHYVELENFPLTLSGKKDKNALPPFTFESTNEFTQYVVPTSDDEKKLTELWQNVLGIKQIGIYDDFFEIGGHSLKANSLRNLIYKSFGVRVSFKDVFDVTTIATQIDLIKKNKSESYFNITKAEYSKDYPLSSSQIQLWIESQTKEGNVAYNMPAVFEFKGYLNIELFKKVFSLLIERHEILRTVFRENEYGEIRQYINPIENNNLHFHFEDFDQIDPLLKEKKIKQIVKQEIQKEFNLAEDSLLKLVLIRKNISNFVFVFVTHHLISDGWSVNIIFKEFVELYNSLSKGLTNRLLPLKIQYKDYSSWQRKLLNRNEYNIHQQYWLKKFGNKFPILELPIDRPRPIYKTYNGSIIYSEISKQSTEKFKEYLLNQECTLFVGLVSLVNMLLYKYTSQADIVIGTVASGRDHIDTEDQLGCYVNTLALRTEFDTNDSYQLLLGKSKITSIEAFEHQMFPFEELVSSLSLPRDMSRNALFDVMLVLQSTEFNAVINRHTIDNIEINRCDFITEVTSKFELVINVEELNDKLAFSIVYNTDIYERETITRLSLHLINLLEGVISSPGSSIKSLGYLSEQEVYDQHSSYDKSLSVEYDKERDIVDYFEEQVLLHPDTIAISHGSLSLTYRELDAQSSRLSRYLHHHYNLTPEDLIGIELPRSEWMIICMLGILKSNCAYLPIDPTYPSERISYMKTDSGCKVTLDKTELEKFQSEESRYSSSRLDRVASLNHLAYVIYTSGTTGYPKGSLIEHRNVVRLFKTSSPLFDFNEKDVWTLFHSYCFDFSVWEIYGALLFGGRLVIVPSDTSKDPDQYLRLLKSECVTVLNQTPSSFYNLIRQELSEPVVQLQLRYVIFGGEALQPVHLRDWYFRYPSTKLVNMYGITETTVHVTYKEITESEIISNISNIGQAIPTLGCYILDSEQQLLPIGVYGELYVGGAGVCRGYLNRPDLTSERFVKNPFKAGDRLYRSGDKARFLPNGDIEYGGRIDEQVKIRGYRIELGEIEALLNSHEGIDTSVVLCKEDGSGEKTLVAYFISTMPHTTSELRSYLSKSLPSYMLPSYYVQLDSFPLTSNGKLDKKLLPAPGDMGTSSGVEYVEPRNEIEIKLVGIWSDILEIQKENIGIKNDFFELGGHSLMTTQLISRIHKTFDIKFEIKNIFINTTLEEQALLITNGIEYVYKEIPLINFQDNYELSSAQKRIWILSQFSDGNVGYNISGVYFLEGNLNREALEQSFDLLITRHEILRTVFKNNEVGEIRQFVKTSKEQNFEILWNNLNLQKHIDILSIVKKEISKPFDLVNGPLLRTTLFKINEEKWVCCFVVHHIVSDGWSMKVMINELFSNYNSIVEKQAPVISPLNIQYKDYSSWQQNLLKTSQLKKQQQYWLTQLGGDLPILELAIDKARPAVKTYHGDVVDVILDKRITNGLKQISHKQGGTLFMGLLTCVNILLHRYSGQEDIIIGSPIAGREHSDLDDQIGIYINTLVLRIKFNGNNNFIDLFQNVKRGTLLAYENQAYPFDALLDLLNLKVNLSRNPLFDVSVALQNAGDIKAENLRLNGLKISKYEEAEDTTSKIDLLFNFVESNDKINLSIVYNTDIYERETITRLSLHLINLLEGVISSPGSSIKSLGYLSEQEVYDQHSSYDKSLSVEYDKERDIVDYFEEQVLLHPDTIAISHGSLSLTYRELDAQSSRLSRYLHHHYNLTPEDLIGIELPRSEWMIICMLGILKSNCAYLPIDPTYPSERISYMKTDSGCKVTLDKTELEKFQSEESRYSSSRLDRVASLNHLAYVIYTSGTTGYPKGSLIEHRNVVRLFKTSSPLFDFNEKDVWTLFHSYCFDFSVWEIYGALLFGGRLVIVPSDTSKDPDQYLRLLKSECVTVLNQTPSSFYNLIRQELSEPVVQLQLRYVIFGGEALQPVHLRDWYFRYPSTKLVNMYGITETTVHVTYKEITESEIISNISNIGQAIPTLGCYILDSEQQLLPIGVYGELYVGGAGVCRGYLNRPDLTSERFVKNPFKAGDRLYRSGDKARFLPNGDIEYGGRIDEQVKIRGYRIELGEIEALLNSHEGIDTSVVLCKEDGSGEKTLVAYFISTMPHTTSELRSYLSKSLPSYMLPSYYVQLDSFPLTSNGKLDKKLLPAPGDMGTSSGVEYVEPRNEIEIKLVGIWSDILEIQKENIGIKNDFFELGGHSLKVTRLSSHIFKEFGLSILIKDLFENNILEDQATLIEKIKWLNSNVEMDNEIII